MQCLSNILIFQGSVTSPSSLARWSFYVHARKKGQLTQTPFKSQLSGQRDPIAVQSRDFSIKELRVCSQHKTGSSQRPIALPLEVSGCSVGFTDTVGSWCEKRKKKRKQTCSSIYTYILNKYFRTISSFLRMPPRFFNFPVFQSLIS